MKKLFNATLTDLLEKQRYQYLWEIKLLSMTNADEAKELKEFCLSAYEKPKAAICLPQHPLKKTDEEIIDFIKKINKNEDQVCVVIAHVDYNPADLQAIYVIDCEEGKEAECFHSILSRWSKCCELYFFKMNTYRVIRKIISSHPKPDKWKFLKKIGHLFTGHDEELIFLYNIHGDMINSSGGKRSVWECPTCGMGIMRNDLYLS